MNFQQQMVDLLKLHEPNEAIIRMCFWILSQPEETSSYSLGTNAGELIRIYSIRQIISAEHGTKIPGNSELLDRLSTIPCNRRVGGYMYSTKNNFVLMIWIDEQNNYLGITRLIPVPGELPVDFDRLQSEVK